MNYRYNYDTINRLVGMDATNGQELRVHYDDKNRVDYNISKVNGQSVKTTYQYGDTANPAQKPGLIYGVKINDQDTVSYAYDDLARIKERTLNLTSPFKSSVNYLSGASPNTTTAMVERLQNGNDILSYTYDDLGNIETISAVSYTHLDVYKRQENGRQLSGGGTGAAGGSFSYDSNDAGLRIRKRGGFGTIDFYYNGDQLLRCV